MKLGLPDYSNASTSWIEVPNGSTTVYTATDNCFIALWCTENGRRTYYHMRINGNDLFVPVPTKLSTDEVVSFNFLVPLKAGDVITSDAAINRPTVAISYKVIPMITV